MSDNPFEEGNAEPNPFQASAEVEPANPFNPSVTDVAPTYDNPAYDDAAPAPVTTFGAYDVGAYGSDAAPASSSSPPSAPAAAVDAYQPSGGAYGGAGTALASAAAAYGSGSKSPRSDGGETSVRVRELEQREAALRRREEEVIRREQALANAGQKNWPFKRYAIAFHDIELEIPEECQRAVHHAHYAFWGLVFCLTYNFLFAASAAFFGLGDFAAWIMAILYLITGVPGAYFFWYARLYNATKNDSALGYAWFFIVFLVHIAFCLFAFIAPPDAFGTAKYSLAGVMSTAEMEKENSSIGGVYAFGAALWFLELLWSVWVIRGVYLAFRGQGHTVTEARNAVAKDAAFGAAKSGARR